MLRISALFLLVILSIHLFVPMVSGQQNMAASSVAGVVEDSNGAAVSGAAVEIVNRGTNQKKTVVTDDSGYFAFNYLAVGDYTLTIQKDGFVTIEQRFTTSISQALELKEVMTIRQFTAAVEVNADVSEIEPTRTRVSETITPRDVDSLPLNGRNFVDLALLVPGVSRTNTGSVQKFAETSAVPGTGISVAGQRNLNNSFIVDGSSANDDSAELAGTFYGEDVIREFQVITNGAGAEYGRASSGYVNILTKSGTNGFNGKLYGYLRNQRFDARNPIAVSKDPLTQTQYGGSLSGPILKDRTFFFANLEQTRRHDANIITIDPINAAAINNRLISAGYRGLLLKTGLVPGGYDTTNFFGRVDHKLNTNNDISVTYNFYDIDAINARTVGGLNDVSRGTNLSNRDHTINTQNVTTLGTKTLNEFRFQYRKSELGAPATDPIGPAVNISGIASFGTAISSPTRRDIDLYQMSDSMTRTFRDHLVKSGAELIHNDLNVKFPGATQGVYTFANLANFNGGIYSQFQQAFGADSQRQKNPNLGIYAQDEWRLRRDITINIGVRYDLQFLPEPIRTDRDNVSPRIGIAFAPDTRTVLRGSVGIYYDRIPTRATSNALQRDGSKYIVAIMSQSTPGAPVFPNVLASQPATFLIKPSISRIDPNIDNGSSLQANLQAERNFGYGMSASVGYLYVRSRHLILSRNINVPTCSNAAQNLCRPDANFGNISYYEGSGDAEYNGMIVSFAKRQGNWLSIRSAYTLSKAIDDAGNFFFSTPQNNFDLKDDRGLSDNDQRHKLTFSGSVSTPLPNKVLNGFQLSWIYMYASRLPFNILLGTDRNGDTNINDRPAGVARNTGRGFNFSELDLRLSKRITFRDRVGLELLAEGFNVLNRSNLSVPNNTFGTGATPLPTFGRATQAYDPRQVQLGLRLSF